MTPPLLRPFRKMPVHLTWFLAACTVFSGPGNKDDIRSELATARARWNSSGVASYEYVLQQKCFCVLGGQKVRVTVLQGVVTAAVHETSGQPVSPQFMPAFVTVERLFELIEDGFRRKAHRIEATYDAQHGFPADFFIDYNQNIADEELGYSATQFRPFR